MKDKISIQRAEKLHPKKRDNFIAFVNECEKTFDKEFDFIRIVQGLRTYEEQHALFLKRPKVTNADAGQSFHNYGLAIDIVPFKNNIAMWQWDFLKFNVIGIKYRLTWGGAWKDYDHFEDNLGFGSSGWKKIINKQKDESGYIIF